MTVLCASLHTLEPAEVRVATQIGIDTGRRPEDILGLPLDCLARDKDGAAVLVYDNVKADRLGRRLPISAATAEVITSQQQRVRQRFPHAPAVKLRLLPTSYRNPDGTKPISRSTLEALLEKIHALQAEPPAGDGTGPAVTRASLQADLLAAHERAIRLSSRIHHLEKRLSEALGDQAWRESGLGAPADIDALSQKITHLEQQVLDLKLQLEERDEDLAAARAANRELMTQLNHPGRPQ